MAAWLNATPAKQTQSRREAIESKGGEDSPELELPPVPDADYIVGYLFEAGPTSGEHVLSWGEIDAWSNRTGVVPSEFEAVTMRRLSGEYLSMLRKAQDPLYRRPVPLTREQMIAKGAREAAAARARHMKE